MNVIIREEKGYWNHEGNNEENGGGEPAERQDRKENGQKKCTPLDVKCKCSAGEDSEC